MLSECTPGTCQSQCYNACILFCGSTPSALSPVLRGRREIRIGARKVMRAGHCVLCGASDRASPPAGGVTVVAVKSAP
eukprot:6320605-Prymnesium_polylepis.1